MRLVIDTSVVIAAIRSSSGASNLLIRMGLSGEFEWLISVALFLEYEAVLTRDEHLSASGLSPNEINLLLNTILDVAIPIRSGFFWPLYTPDPEDTHVLNLVLIGKADALVTYNVKHFAPAALEAGIHLEAPDRIIRRLRS